jgi:hypothetical protein
MTQNVGVLKVLVLKNYSKFKSKGACINYSKSYSGRLTYSAFRRKVLFGRIKIAHDTDDIRSNRCFHLNLRGGGLADIISNTCV